MLVTTLFWSIYDGDHLKILVTFSAKKTVTNIWNCSSTCQTCHQHKLISNISHQHRCNPMHQKIISGLSPRNVFSHMFFCMCCLLCCISKMSKVEQVFKPKLELSWTSSLRTGLEGLDWIMRACIRRVSLWIQVQNDLTGKQPLKRVHHDLYGNHWIGMRHQS